MLVLFAVRIYFIYMYNPESVIRSAWSHYLKKIGNLFRRESGPDYQRALTEYSRSLTLIVDLEQLMEHLVGKLREIADIPRVIIFMRDAETGLFRAMDSRGISVRDRVWNVSFSQEDRLIQWLSVNEMTLIVDEEPGVVGFLSREEQDMLQHLGVKVVVPLLVMNHVKGMVFLGEKRDGRSFSSREQELLTTLLSQSALAFENAILYQEQKQRFRKMFRADRLATIGQIAAGAAHEIRNPLTTIRSTMQYLMKKSKEPGHTAMLAELMKEVDRIDEIIHGMLSFSKPAAPQKEAVSVSGLIRQAETLIGSLARRNGVSIVFEDGDRRAVIDADPSQIKQVLINVILNGIQAMPEGGRLHIHVEPAQMLKQKSANFYRIQIRDQGTGIPEDVLMQIFDPFFTTKKEGTGLGLSICYGIVQQHGGEIEISSETEGKEKGTEVNILLPAAG